MAYKREPVLSLHKEHRYHLFPSHVSLLLYIYIYLFIYAFFLDPATHRWFICKGHTRTGN